MNEQRKRKKIIFHEKILSRELGKAWRLTGGKWYKIPDAKGFTAMFTGKRPFDMLASVPGIPFCIEAKYTAAPAFSLDDMKPHQIPSLTEWAEQGFRSYVLVFYGGKMQRKVADFFTIQMVNGCAAQGQKKLLPEQAALRIYKVSGEWQISKRQIYDMVERGTTDDYSLFVKR